MENGKGKYSIRQLGGKHCRNVSSKLHELNILILVMYFILDSDGYLSP